MSYCLGSYAFNKLLAKKDNLCFYEYVNVLEPYDIIYSVERDGRIIYSSSLYLTAFNRFKYEVLKMPNRLGCLIVITFWFIGFCALYSMIGG